MCVYINKRNKLHVPVLSIKWCMALHSKYSPHHLQQIAVEFAEPQRLNQHLLGAAAEPVLLEQVVGNRWKDRQQGRPAGQG